LSKLQLNPLTTGPHYNLAPLQLSTPQAVNDNFVQLNIVVAVKKLFVQRWLVITLAASDPLWMASATTYALATP